MQPISQAVLLSWSIPPAATFALLLTALIYGRGWFLLRRAGVPFVPPWRAASFLLGLLALWIALASPFDTFSPFVLTAHMLQHMMLMMVAPPLILLGAPLIPLVRGLPIFAAREFAGPFLNWRPANRFGAWLTHPVVALILMGVTMFAWHTPRLYELALASSSWHEVEHACFFLASVIFWWPVVQPWPSHAQWPRWAIVPYLLLGDLQNTALSAILTFADRVVYPSYAVCPRLFGFSAQQDQSAAGAIMWVIGSLVFLIPAVGIALQCMQGNPHHPAIPAISKRNPSASNVLSSAGNQPSLINRVMGKGVRRIPAAHAVWFVVLFLLCGLSLAYLASRPSDDDQVVRLQQQSGRFAVVLFAPAGDLEAGASTFGALVQDGASREVLTDATVELTAVAAGGSSQVLSTRASAAGSENKLLQTVEVTFPTDGDWTLHLAVVRNQEHAAFFIPLHVTKPETGFDLPWPYLVWFVFAAILLLSYMRRHWGRLPASSHQTAAQSASRSSSSDLS